MKMVTARDEMIAIAQFVLSWRAYVHYLPSYNRMTVVCVTVIGLDYLNALVRDELGVLLSGV